MVNLSITPNQLSWLSLISMILAALLFSFGDYFYSIVGVVFFHFSLFLNRLDGAVAKAKKMVTFYGKWLNDIFDDIRYPIAIIGIIIGVPDPTIRIIGCIAITSSLYHKIVLRYSKNFLFETPKAIPHLFDEIFVKVLHYSIIVLALLNIVQFFVWIYAPYAVIYCLATFYIYHTAIKNIEISKTIREDIVE